MKGWRHVKRTAAGFVLLPLMLFGGTGCARVQGWDAKKALIDNAAVVSYEGQASLSFEVLKEPGTAMSEEAEQLTAALQGAKISLDSIAKQDQTHASYRGTFTFAGQTVSFRGLQDGSAVTLLPENARRPIRYEGGLAGFNPWNVFSLTEDQREQLREKTVALRPQLYAFLLDKAPGPAKAALSRTEDTINGQTVPVARLEFRMEGDELRGWMRSLLLGILGDEAGIAGLVGQWYDLLSPAFTGEGSPVEELLSRRETAVPLLKTMAQGYLTRLYQDLDPDQGEPSSRTASRILAIRSVQATADFDAEMRLRKADFDLVIMPSDLDMAGTRGIHISGSLERWKLNGPVQAEALNSDNAVDIGPESEPSLLLAAFDETSPVYRLLQDTFHVNRRVIRVHVGEDDPPDGKTPYIRDGSALIPLSLAVEKLNAEVLWDNTRSQAVITDSRTGTEAVFTPGSDSAMLNGRPVPLGVPAELAAGTVFVPLRFLAESFGAKVSWDNRTRTVMIVRE